MKALVTGGAGFIGSHLSERLLDHGAEVRAIDCFTDFYPRPLKERNLGGPARPRRATSSSRGDLRDADLPALLDGVTHVFHLAAQAGVRRAGDRSSASTPRSTSTRRSVLLEACVERPIERARLRVELVGLRRRGEIPMGRRPLPQPVSPYGVTKLAAEQLCHLYYVNHRVPTVVAALLHRLRPAAAPGHGLQPLLHGDSRRSAAHPVRRRPADARLHLRGRRRRGRPPMPPSAACPGASTILVEASRVSLREVFDLIARVSGRKVTIDQQAPQKGDMRDTYADTTRATDRPGLRAVGDARRRPSGDVALDGSDESMTDPDRVSFGFWSWRSSRALAGCAAARGQRCRREPPTRTSSCSSAARRR